jgi:hypothetical protein
MLAEAPVAALPYLDFFNFSFHGRLPLCFDFRLGPAGSVWHQCMLVDGHSKTAAAAHRVTVAFCHQVMVHEAAWQQSMSI